MDNRPIVAVYDSDFIPFYVCHNKKDTEEKTLEECIFLADNLIENVNKSVKAEYYTGYTTKGKCFRYYINPTYKANRKDVVFAEYSKEVREHIVKNHGFKNIEGYEADDAVVSFKYQHSDKYECIIISPDKDIINLEGTHYNPRKSEYVYTTQNDADVYFWKSMIIGDSGDNVKGIPGKGEAYFRDHIDINDDLKTQVFNDYIRYLGELEGINEFYKNYRSLKLINTIELGDIKLNNVIK